MVLTTLIPEFYARHHGFRPVTEHAFTRAVETPTDDAHLLGRLSAARTPVSEQLGCLDAATVFVFTRLLTSGVSRMPITTT